MSGVQYISLVYPGRRSRVTRSGEVEHCFSVKYDDDRAEIHRFESRAKADAARSKFFTELHEITEADVARAEETLARVIRDEGAMDHALDDIMDEHLAAAVKPQPDGSWIVTADGGAAEYTIDTQGRVS